MRKWALRGQHASGYLLTVNPLVASEELGGEEEVLPREGRGEDTAVQLGLARGFQSGSSIGGLGLLARAHPICR